MKNFLKAVLILFCVGVVALVVCYFKIPSFKEVINEKFFKIEQKVEDPKNESSDSEYIKENETLRSENESLKNELEKIKEENQQDKETINELRSEISEKETLINDALENKTRLEELVDSLDSEVESLNKECDELEKSIQELELSAAADAETIAELQADITAKQNQIAELQTKRDELLVLVADQEKQLLDMKASIQYYENYLKSLETEEKVFATIVVDGKVVDIQELNKGSNVTYEDPELEGYQFDGWFVDGVIVDLTAYKVETNTTFVAQFTKLHTVVFESEGTTISTQIVRNNEYAQEVDIESTTYKVFNGWLLNGELVNVETITITEDTTFVASYTYKYDVNFVVDNQTTTQIVVKGSYPESVEDPNKDGFEFDGWLMNGQLVNPHEVEINQTTTFVAQFTKLHTVVFESEGTTISTQIVRNNEYAEDVEMESSTYKVFNGWLLNGELVDVETTTITSDTTFIASYTNKYTVTYYVDGVVYHSEVVDEGSKLTKPTEPTKEGYKFEGWLKDDVMFDFENSTIEGDIELSAGFSYSQGDITPDDGNDNQGSDGDGGDVSGGDSGGTPVGGKPSTDSEQENEYN